MSPGDLLLRPEGLPLLLLVPAAWAALRARDRSLARRRAALLGPRPAEAAPGADPRWDARRTALLAAGLLLALVAALEPAAASGSGDAAPRGADLAVCLDVSRSMRAGDLVPDRLERAKAAIRSLAARTRGDRFALVVFAGDARLLVPLTRDAGAFAALAAGAGPLSVDRGGSDPGAAIAKALEALLSGGRGTGAILVLSDGEDRAGGGPAAAARCAELGVAVHAVGFGTEEGGKIPSDAGPRAGFLRDRGGREVVTRLEAAPLRSLAGATGGAFADARDGEAALEAFLDGKVLEPARGSSPAEERRRRRNDYQWPLAGAVLLWSLAWCAHGRRPS